MRKIVAAAFVSLDGVMQAPGGPQEDTDGGFALGGWTAPHFDAALGESMGGLFAEPFDLLLGRRTYDIFAAHWPVVETLPEGAIDEGERAIGRAFGDTVKYVATHRPQTLTWRNSRALGPDVPAALAEIKRGEGPMLLVQGSSDLLQTLLAHDLVDTLRLMTFPVVLGAGKRLFGRGTLPGAWTVTQSTVSTGGVVVARYERAGDVKTGSFALDAEQRPTDA